MAGQSEPIRVLCVDDHPIVREGLTSAISDQPDMVVIGEAATGEDAVALFKQHRPDITLMDLRLRGMSGLDAIRAIHEHDVHARVIVLTMYEGDEDIHRALAAGAAAYLLKDTLSDDLLRVVREVHAGGAPMTSEVEARLAERAAQPKLTPREIEVIGRVASGRRNKEIADDLGIRLDTVEVHLRNIFTKLGAKERISAVKIALRRGIVHVD
jgi:two-component system, NarL family, response regulator